MNFHEATYKLNGRRSKKLENNTYLEQIDADTIGVKLHSTYVVRIHRDGSYTLDSGGWRTVTTKDRINRYGPCYIHQRKGVWWLDSNTPFEDCVRIDAAGQILDNPFARN